MPRRAEITVATALLCTAAALLPAFAQENSHQDKTPVPPLEGTWRFVLIELDGVKPPRQKQKPEEVKTITFHGTKFEVKQAEKVVQAGTARIDAGKNPITIDLDIAEGEAKGTVQLGICEPKGDTLKICLDLKGKKRPSKFQTVGESGYLLASLQPELKAGPDPLDASVVYDRIHLMNSGFTAKTAWLTTRPPWPLARMSKWCCPIRIPSSRRNHQADSVLIYMENRVQIGAHLTHGVSVTDYREKMGCAVKLEKGALLIGTFGEFSFLEGGTSMKLLVLVPAKVKVEQRVGLIGGYGGRAGSVRPPTAINPTRDDPRPALANSKEGTKDCWLPPTAEDGWHTIPAVADVQRRGSEVKKGP